MPKFQKTSIFFLLLLAIIASQYFVDLTEAGSIKPSPYVPNAQAVKAVDLGLDSAASSLYWLASIQYIGDWQTDGYSKLADYIKLSNSLDPKFSHPYAFATLILPSLNQFDTAIEIGNSGIANADPDWEIPYYMATSYHTEKEDSVNAAKYFDIAARTPGAPDNIKWLAANYGSRPDLRYQTELIWQAIADSSKDEQLKARAENYLYHFAIMDLIEEAAQQYKDSYGSYPNPIEQLVDKNILKGIPQDPFGYTFYIDESGRTRLQFNN